MRTLVDIPDDKITLLDALARRRRGSRAKAVRQGIALLLAEEQAADKAALDLAFGAWKDQAIDGVAFERALRDEWEDWR